MPASPAFTPTTDPAFRAGHNYAAMAIHAEQVKDFAQAAEFLTAATTHFTVAMAENDSGVLANPDTYYEFVGGLVDGLADRLKTLAQEVRAAARKPPRPPVAVSPPD